MRSRVDRDKERQPRLAFILDKLLRDGEATIEEVQERFDVSDRTARSDIVALSQMRTRRTRGGIAQARGTFYCDDARTKDLEAKEDVAEEAALEFTPGTSLAASPGSTVALTYASLLGNGISCNAVTNSIALTEHAAGQRSAIYLVAGDFSPHINGLIGDDAVKGFRLRKCRCGLLGVSGIALTPDGQCALYVQHDAEVPVLGAMLDEVQEKIVVVVNVQKLGHADPWKIGALGDLKKSPAGHLRDVVVVTNDLRAWKSQLGSGAKAAENTFKGLLHLQRQKTIRLRIAQRRIAGAIAGGGNF